MGALAVLWDPAGTLRESAAERRVLTGFVVTTIYAALSLASGAILVFGGGPREQFQAPGGPGLPPEMMDNVMAATGIGILLFSAAGPFAWWVLVSLLMHLTTRSFGGTGPLSGMFAVTGVAQIPFVIGGVVAVLASALQLALGLDSAAGSVIGLLNGLLGLAFLVWHVALVTIGAALARGIGYGESTGSCAISCVGLVLLIIIVAVVFGVGMAFLLSGST